MSTGAVAGINPMAAATRWQPSRGACQLPGQRSGPLQLIRSEMVCDSAHARHQAFKNRHDMRQLFEIEDVFDLTGRGCVLVPGVPHAFPGSVKAGATILIEPPSGRAFETRIVAFELVNRGRLAGHTPFSVLGSIGKGQLPVGSKVLLRERPLTQHAAVRVRKLVQLVDDYDPWQANRNPPSIGDTGTLIDILTADGLPPKYLVERSGDDGRTIWLSEFWTEEIEATEEPAA